MKPKERPRLDSEAIPNFLELRKGEVRRIHLLKLFGNSQARARRLTIRRIMAAYTNASALAHSLS